MDRAERILPVVMKLIIAAVLLAAAVWAGYTTIIEQGYTCASGGGPASCVPKGTISSPARIITGAIFWVPMLIGGLAMLRSALRSARNAG